MSEELRIVFMGTPDFAVPSLDILLKNKFNVVGAITAPDRPAGRGQKLRESAVKRYAVSKGIHLLQPTNLKSEVFLNELKSLKANLQIVVAFRMLPELVWRMPKFGTFNLHASLLPQYRGAAPINWAIINGENETGVSTFFLEQIIDTGKIILQESTHIGENETAGELHDRLMVIGSELVLRTVKNLESGYLSSHAQNEDVELKPAPKIFKSDCQIDWNKPLNEIHNHIRGLSPYPTAWTELKHKKTTEIISCKIFESRMEQFDNQGPFGLLVDKESLKFSSKDGFLHIPELQLAGKKRMNSKTLMNGFNFNNYILV